MEILLRAKHWQIFLLSFGLFPLIFIFITLTDIFTLFDDTMANSDLDLRMILLVQTLCLVFANFWIYAIGTRLHKKHYYNSFMLLIFRLAIYFSTFFHATRFLSFPAVPYFDNSINMVGLVLTLAGGIYCNYFAARLLNSVEQERDVTFQDFSGDFFAFIFYPIGVWWLQPRINRIFGRDKQMYDPNSPLDQHVTN